MEIINYSKFKIEVFSSAGELIKEACFNSIHNFYCNGLTPGQKYSVVFSYDDILLLIADFYCDISGKVVYLSPAHFVFNNSFSLKPFKAGSELTTKIKRREECKVPFQLWEKRIIENYISSNRGEVSMCCMKRLVPRFKAGAALAKSVK